MKVAIACVNANGEADFFVTDIEVTNEEIADDSFTDLAIDKAVENDYSGPFVVFGPNDFPSIARAAGLVL